MKITALVWFMSWGIALGQTRFEVVSLKLSNGQPIGAFGSDGGPGTRYPERFATNATLENLVNKAFGLRDSAQIKGPGWIGKDEYAIDAQVPPGTSQEQFQVMLQNLLVERFGLSYHREAVTLPIYELVVAKGAVKFRESSAKQGEVASTPAARGNDRDGFPLLPPGRPAMAATHSFSDGQQQTRLSAQEQTMTAFAQMLSSNAGRVVMDKTGLLGKYDFTLYFQVPPSGATAERPALTIFDALELQLGLRLIDEKASFDKIVIDHVERVPAEN